MARIVSRGSLGNEITGTEEVTINGENDLTICDLCKKNLFAPKNFPCLHSFCEMCITDYVKNYKKPKKMNGQTPNVTCPTCETPITFRSVDNPKEFAESLQTSTMATSLLLKGEKARECSLCSETGKRQAEFWCFYCAHGLCEEHENYHKAVTSSKTKHKVLPIKKVREIPDSLYKSQSCRFHEKTPIVNFCMDHLTSFCAVCWKRMHKLCNVIPIEQAARIVNKSRISYELEQKIDYLLAKVKDTLVERNEFIEDIEKQRSSTIKSVKNFRKSLDKYIDSLQANLELDVETHYRHIKDQLEKEVHDFENKRKNFEHYKNLMKSIREFSQPIQSLSELTDIRQQCAEIEESIGRYLFQMKEYRLSASFISTTQVAHVISKLGSAVTSETSRRSKSRVSEDMHNRSRVSSHKSSSSKRSEQRSSRTPKYN